MKYQTRCEVDQSGFVCQNDAIGSHDELVETMRNVSAMLRDIAGRNTSSSDYANLHELADTLYNKTIAKAERKGE